MLNDIPSFVAMLLLLLAAAVAVYAGQGKQPAYSSRVAIFLTVTVLLASGLYAWSGELLWGAVVFILACGLAAVTIGAALGRRKQTRAHQD